MKNEMIGNLYINRLQPLETVIVTSVGQKEMWGRESMYNVTIIHYEMITSSIGVNLNIKSKTTKHNFYEKYISREELRDDKLNQLLNEH